MITAASMGLLLAFWLLPAWGSSILASLAGPDVKAYWYLSRATAISGYVLLWLSMVMGLLMTGRLAQSWPGALIASEVHKFVSLLGLGFSLFHALVLLGDQYMGFTLSQLLVPFASVHYLPFWVGLGQTGFYLWGLVVLSFYLRCRIGRKTWRVIHFLTFGLYLMVLVHGLTSGSDAGTDWAFYLYWISGSITLVLTLYRVMAKSFGVRREARATTE